MQLRCSRYYVLLSANSFIKCAKKDMGDQLTTASMGMLIKNQKFTQGPKIGKEKKIPLPGLEPGSLG